MVMSVNLSLHPALWSIANILTTIGQISVMHSKVLHYLHHPHAHVIYVQDAHPMAVLSK